MSVNLTKRERKARIRKGLPIEALGLQFFPITMADYEEFLECKSVLAIRMTSLAKANIEYLSMPFLSVLWAIELDSIMQTGKAVGFFERIIRLLYLSLRLEYDSEKAFNNIYCEQNNPRNLFYIEVTQTDGQPVKISPMDFQQKIRPLLAEQNGIELPDESETPEIVKTENDLQQDGGNKLKYDLDTLLASVANASGVRECEMYCWSVIEFERRKQAIERKVNYTIYAQAEMSGMVKFQKGNPYLSWCLDRAENISSALITTEQLNSRYNETNKH